MGVGGDRLWGADWRRQQPWRSVRRLL